uniref:G_PROTEIN_RECEP_F1_2 domain-containing protein n=1 Tax=Strongyloides venezuelensis TaxID=75913 RepID=A0A0K0FIR3_STRVS
MNASTIPKYLYPEISFQNYEVLVGYILTFIPNVYFFHRSITYKPFSDRAIFKYMTMVMTFELIFSAFIHVFYNGYMIINERQNTMIELHLCSKLNIIDLNVNQLLIVTPLYFNIYRFHKIIFNKNPNIIIIIIAIFITMAPLLYMMTGQYLEINIYYVPKKGCGYQIFSNIPYYITIMYINIFVVLFIPFVSFFLNYLIYRTVIRRTSISNRAKIREYNGLFKGIAIQSIFPFFCQVPGVAYQIFFTFTRQNYFPIEVAINFVLCVGHGFCIFLSMVVIQEFRNMIFRDFRIMKQIPIHPHSTMNIRIKSSHFV